MAKPALKKAASLAAAGVDVRDAFFETLFRLASLDKNLILLTDDQGAFALEKFKKSLPGQYLNVGIAEQTIITVAAGLALAGKRPFVYGISTFMTFRCYEQIKVDLCCMNLPVTIVGSGAGYTYGSDGPTHHATQDVSVMRVLPEITIYNPSDASMTSAVAELAYQGLGPKYIRIEKGVLPKIYDEGHNFSKGFEVLKKGRDVVIVSTGFMVHQALRTAKELARRSIDAGVIDLYRIKPVDAPALYSALKTAKRVVSLEEHSIVGGMGSLLGEILLDQGHGIPLKRIGLSDGHCYEYGNREWLHRRGGLNSESVIKKILDNG